jgi:hypothetical protein
MDAARLAPLGSSTAASSISRFEGATADKWRNGLGTKQLRFNCSYRLELSGKRYVATFASNLMTK